MTSQTQTASHKTAVNLSSSVLLFHPSACYASSLGVPKQVIKVSQLSRNNSNVLFYVLFLQIGAHSPLQRTKHSQNKLPWACAPTHTHTCTQAHTHTQTINRIVWRGEISKRMWKLSVFDGITLQGKVFQTVGASQEKDLWPSDCVHTEGKQRIEVSSEDHSWWVGLLTVRSSVK